MRAIRRYLLACVGVLLSLTLTASAVEAQSARRVYQDGVEALQQNKAREAVTLLQNAIRMDGEEKRRVGFRGDPYLPYYYLGEALFALDDCEGATQAWETSRSQGVVQGFDQNRELQRKSALCQNRQEVANLAASARTFLGAVEEAAGEARSLLDDPELGKFLQDTGLRERLQGAENALRTAASGLEQGVSQESQSAIRQVQSVVKQAENAIAAVNRDAETHLEQRRVEISARLSTRLESAGQTLRSTDYLAPFPPGVLESRGLLGGLMETAESGRDEMSLGDLLRLTSELEKNQRRLAAAAVPPSEELLQAASAFLSGDYAGALEVLEELQLGGREAAHAHLLRAASLFSMAIASEESDELLSRARDEVRQCAAIDGSLVPTDTVFSPRFVTFFSDALREDEVAESAGDEGGESIEP